MSTESRYQYTLGGTVISKEDGTEFRVIGDMTLYPLKREQHERDQRWSWTKLMVMTVVVIILLGLVVILSVKAEIPPPEQISRTGFWCTYMTRVLFSVFHHYMVDRIGLWYGFVFPPVIVLLFWSVARFSLHKIMWHASVRLSRTVSNLMKLHSLLLTVSGVVFGVSIASIREMHIIQFIVSEWRKPMNNTFVI